MSGINKDSVCPCQKLTKIQSALTKKDARPESPIGSVSSICIEPLDTGHRTLCPDGATGQCPVRRPDTGHQSQTVRKGQCPVQPQNHRTPDTGHQTSVSEEGMASVSGSNTELPDTGHRTSSSHRSRESKSRKDKEGPDTGHRTSVTEEGMASMSGSKTEPPDTGR